MNGMNELATGNYGKIVLCDLLKDMSCKEKRILERVNGFLPDLKYSIEEMKFAILNPHYIGEIKQADESSAIGLFYDLKKRTSKGDELSGLMLNASGIYLLGGIIIAGSKDVVLYGSKMTENGLEKSCQAYRLIARNGSLDGRLLTFPYGSVSLQRSSGMDESRLISLKEGLKSGYKNSMSENQTQYRTNAN